MILRALVLCALLLVASAALNVWQYGRGVDAAAQCRGEAMLVREVGKAEGRAAALSESHTRARQLVDLAVLDNAQLLRELRQIADRARERVTVYRERVNQLPAATCAPGPDRMDAINAMLGAAE